MMERSFPVPSEQRLAQLIESAFEQGPAPDTGPISEVLDACLRQHRLQRRRPTRRPPWWVVGFLLIGASAAAWWLSEVREERELPPATVQEESMGIPKEAGQVAKTKESEQVSTEPSADTEQAEPQGSGETTEEGRSPVIYRRETY